MTRAPAGLSLLLVLTIALGVLGCGSSTSGPEPPQRCIDRWNDDEIAKTLGKHAYDGHEVRNAKVEEIEAPASAKNVRTERTCLVVFSIADGDKEAGRLGLVVTKFGWSQLFELGESDAELLELQKSASTDSNASLFPDGSLE